MINFPDSPTVGQIYTDANYAWIWDGEKWIAGNTPALKYIVGCFVPGLMLANQQLLMHKVSKAIRFPANFSSVLGHSSQARGVTTATGSTIIQISKATAALPLSFTPIGTITIGPGALLGTFATTGGAVQTFNTGDTISLVAPATPDATFANFTSTLVGSEV